jgi:tRNA-dihydrouridine synthase
MDKPQSLKLRGLEISPPLFLAPMAGLTHSALRRLILEQGGIGLLSTEMLSAARLPSESPQLSPYLVRTAQETPLSYQLLVSRVEEVAPAIAKLHALGAEAIDLNLGCPAPTVRRMGAGSRLMEEPATVQALVAAARKQTGLPLTAKIRLGETLDEEKLREFCLMLEGEGVDLLSVHARLRGEPFVRKPRWPWVGKVKGGEHPGCGQRRDFFAGGRQELPGPVRGGRPHDRPGRSHPALDFRRACPWAVRNGQGGWGGEQTGAVSALYRAA